MQPERITLNEVVNNGKQIHLYREVLTGLWIAFGYSAYHLAQRKELQQLSGYADALQMPYTCITERALREIAQRDTQEINTIDGYFLLTSEQTIEADAYRNWVNSVK